MIGELAPVAETGISPPLHVAVKLVIGLPLSFPAVNVNATCVFVTVACVIEGASGIDAGFTDGEGGDSPLVPSPLVASTVQVYDAPLVRPLTVIGELGPDCDADPAPPEHVAL